MITNWTSELPMLLVLLILLFVGLVLYMIGSFFYKKKINKNVDQLEAWKINLENRPFSSELSRLKGLIMAGETETRFEKWKSDWEEILTTFLPDIEETLIDIDDYADRHRFVKCNQVIKETKTRLKEIELSLDYIVQEIDELTSSEEDNRGKAALLHEQYQELRSSLEKNIHSFGISYPVWHERLKKSLSWFDRFTEAQQNGDYLSARDFLEAIEEIFGQIKEALEHIPTSVQEIEDKIPAQITEVEQAVYEMKEKGYLLEHTDVEMRIDKLKSKKHQVVPHLQNGHIQEMKLWIEEMFKEIDILFSLLEEEVESKTFVFSTIQQIPEQMEELKSGFTQITDESELTKKAYSWEQEWDVQLSKINQLYTEVEQLHGQLSIEDKELNHTYPTLKSILVQFQEKREDLLQLIEEYDQFLRQLRQEELTAKEDVNRLKQTINKLKMNLRKVNLPGVPEHLETGIRMAEEAIVEVENHLGEIPLEMNRVFHHLKEAKTQVESVSQVSKSIIQQAYKAEQYIQYGNRFRRSHEEARIMLEEAESFFRKFQYREALELAEEALDRVDKYWRNRLEPDEESVS